MTEQLLAITLTRSPIGRPKRHRLTLATLGLTKMHRTVRHRDTPSIRGMVRQVAHLVHVEVIGSK